LKRRAAERAAEWIRDGMTVGLGTGSTVRHLLDHIAERRAAGEWGSIAGVPTSEQTAARARELGIPLRTLGEAPEVDLTIDGADEVDPELRLIKGLGGALLREKVVATASRRLVIIVDESKVVAKLGTRSPLPVEVDPFGAAIQPPFPALAGRGADPAPRRGRRSPGHRRRQPDLRLPLSRRDQRPGGAGGRLDGRVGVMENGLFLGLATAVVVAGADGVRTVEREGGR
jgi:ribose 5-phosphate isomerase A